MGSWFFRALFPPKCLICRKEGFLLCPNHKTLPIAPKSEAVFHHLDAIFAATKYKDKTVHKVIEYFKFKGFKDLASVMAEPIVEKWPDNFPPEGVLIPIPLHWTRQFWRGFNQSHLLAKSIVKRKKTLTILDNLKRSKKTHQQAKLKKHERIHNLDSAFVWRGSTIPETVILVDDVVTSGTTLDMAAKVLKQAGAKKVIAVTFARGGGSE